MRRQGGLTGDGSGGRRSMVARGVIAGLVGHCEGEVGGECGRLGGNANVGVAGGFMVALVAADAPRSISRDGAPVDAHGVEGVDTGVVVNFGAADSVEEAPDGEPGQIEEGKCVCAMHGRDEATLPKVGMEADDVEHLGKVAAELERVVGDDPVEGERVGREGVAGAAGHMRKLLAGNAGAGNFSVGGHVSGCIEREREDAEESVDAIVAELAVGEGELQACVERGRGGRGRGRGQHQVASLDMAEDKAVGATELDGVSGRVDDHGDSLVRLKAEEERGGAVAEAVDAGEVK